MKYFHIPAGIDVILNVYPGSVSWERWALVRCMAVDAVAIATVSVTLLVFRATHFFPSRYYILVGKTSSLSLLCVSTWCVIVGVSYALAYFKFSNIPYSHISTYENLMHGNPVWYTCYIPTHRPHSFLISHFFFTHYLLPRRNIIPYICCVCAFFDFTSLSFSISILSFGFMTFYVFSPGFALQLFF